MVNFCACDYGFFLVGRDAIGGGYPPSGGPFRGGGPPLRGGPGGGLEGGPGGPPGGGSPPLRGGVRGAQKWLTKGGTLGCHFSTREFSIKNGPVSHPQGGAPPSRGGPGGEILCL